MHDDDTTRPDDIPAADVAPLEKAPSILELFEIFLKRPARLHAAIRDERFLPALLPRLLVLALAGFTAFGATLSVLCDLAGASAPWLPEPRWRDGSALRLVLAYDVGLIAACGICLPSFYFFGLLSGIRLRAVQVAAFALECLAATAVVLVGLLPVATAALLGLHVLGAPGDVVEIAIVVAMTLPFISGLWGVQTLLAGLFLLVDTIPEDRRIARACFLRRLVTAWAACYTAVSPVMIWVFLDALLGARS